MATTRTRSISGSIMAKSISSLLLITCASFPTTTAILVSQPSSPLLLPLSLLPLLVTSNSILDDGDRPRAAKKVNSHAYDDFYYDDDDYAYDDYAYDDFAYDDFAYDISDDDDGENDNIQKFYNDFGEIETKYDSCNDDRFYYHDEDDNKFNVVHDTSSMYQDVIFEESSTLGDKCLMLDETLQQCLSYRPHYHEPFVHFCAAYLNNKGNKRSQVKRVVFVGGGDSMLLHEILKYENNLELVLGLELDQTVTRSSFEHFNTQPHFDNPKVQWWFGDGAKSLTMLPRMYFGTFDLVLLDLSETVMSMTVTKGLDVFGAMKLLLSPTGILVKNDFGYFEKLAKVFDTCLQLVIPNVTYICDYELVLCGSDEVDFLDPTFDHLKGVGEGQVETLVYKPQEDIDNHWGPVTDYSKYWGEPRECVDVEGADNDGIDPESVAYAGILMIVEAENVSLDVVALKNTELTEALAQPVKDLGYYNVITTVVSANTTKSGGLSLIITMKEGYILAELWPKAKYCKLDIHLWGGFEKQEDLRTSLLVMLGSATSGDWQSYRIVTGGMRGTDTRSNDLATVGPDLTKIGMCDPIEEGSVRSIRHDTSYDDAEAMQPIIDAGLNDIIPMMMGTTTTSRRFNAVVLCGVQDAPCPARDNLEKKGFANLVTLIECSPEEEALMESSFYERRMALRRWRKAIATTTTNNTTEFSMCGKTSTEMALRDIAKKIKGINLVVADATTAAKHVFGAHQYCFKYWKVLPKPSLMLVPILDANDEVRTSFLKSRHNEAENDPGLYSEIFVGDGRKTMSFGMIHEGSSIRNLFLVKTTLDQNPIVKFVDVRKITIRGVIREQVNYNPVAYSWDDYDQRPGLEQFYGQHPVGLQSVYQLGTSDVSSSETTAKQLSSKIIQKAFKIAAKRWSRNDKEMSEATTKMTRGGAMYAALSPKMGQVVITWDGDKGINVNIFTYKENVNLHWAFVDMLNARLPDMDILLSDEQPRGYGKVVNTSDRINRDETPDCHDNYQMCPSLTAKGHCVGEEKDMKKWMEEHCRFSCKHCDKNSLFAKNDELCINMVEKEFV